VRKERARADSNYAEFFIPTPVVRVTEVPLVRAYYDTIIARINERGTPARRRRALVPIPLAGHKDSAESRRSRGGVSTLPSARARELPRATLPLMSLATARGAEGGVRDSRQKSRRARRPDSRVAAVE